MNSLRLLVSFIVVAGIASTATWAQPVSRYDLDTRISTLLADPAAKAVLTKHLPTMFPPNSNLMERAYAMTLRDARQAFIANTAGPPSDELYARIEKELAALPPKK